MGRPERLTVAISSISAFFGFVAAMAATWNAYTARENLQTYIRQNLHSHHIQLCAQVVADAEALVAATRMACARRADCRERGTERADAFVENYAYVTGLAKSVAQLEVIMPKGIPELKGLVSKAQTFSSGSALAEEPFRTAMGGVKDMCRTLAMKEESKP